MDRPPEDAGADAIARFLEGDFWEKVATGVEETAKEQSDDDDANDSDEDTKHEEFGSR